MSPKKKEEKEENVSNETPQENNDRVEETKKKTNTRTKKKKTTEELYTLIDLVNQFKDEDHEIVIKLAKNGYYNRYNREVELNDLGYVIQPSMSITEFKKIIK